MREMKDSGVAWIGEIPKSWNLERLQWHISEIKETNKPEKTKQILSLTNKRGVIPYEEKGAQGNVSKEDLSQYKLAYPGTIVANSMNVLIGSVGKCNYYGCVSPVYYVYKPNDGENLEFINYIFQTEQFQKELRRYANGILEIRLRVSSDGILKRKVAFPSTDEQQKIVVYLNQKLSQVDSLIANVQAQIEKLKAYKQSLITEVVTKGLDPNVPMKDSGVEWIGKIPEDWEVVKTGRLFKENNRSPIGNDIPLSLSQMDGLVATDDMKESALKTSSYDNWKRVEIGDLVLNRFKAHLGVLFAANLTGIVSFHYGVYEAKRSLVPKFYEYLYHSNQYKAILGNASNGMVVGLQNLSNLGFYSTYSLYPPYAEQEKLVSHLDKKCSEIDELIALKQSKIEKLEQYKKSLIYEYVTGKKEVV